MAYIWMALTWFISEQLDIKFSLFLSEILIKFVLQLITSNN